MSISLLIFVVAVVSVVSAAPKIYSYPDYGSMDYVNHGMDFFNNGNNLKPPFPSLDHDVNHDGGSNNEHDNGNQNVPHSITCRPSEAQKNVPGMDSWCNANCFHIPPYCPASHCQCY